MVLVGLYVQRAKPSRAPAIGWRSTSRVSVQRLPIRSAMTDFYTVLCNALDRVGTADIDQRNRVYTHVRDVMVRKLRNHRPPLAEAEIESRITTFETAIDRIEDELAELQRLENSEALVPRELQADDSDFEYPSAPQAPYPGSEWDEQPNPTGSELAHWDPDMPPPEPMWGSPAIDMAWDESSSQWHDSSGAVVGAPVGEPHAEEEVPATNGFDTSLKPESALQRFIQIGRAAIGRVEHRATSWRNGEDVPARPNRARRRPIEQEQSRSNGLTSSLFGRKSNGRSAPEFNANEARAKRRGQEKAVVKRRGKRIDRTDPIDELAGRLESEGLGPRREPILLERPDRATNQGLFLPSPERIAPLEDEEELPSPRQRRQRQGRTAGSPPQTETVAGAPRNPRRNRSWRLFLLAFAIAVIAWSAYVFIPIMFPATPTNDGPGAEEVAAVEAVVGETIVLFRGEDPTVFEAGPDNPVQYQGDATGGYVSITSSITSGGARAVIGPGLANRLAGHEVRVLLDARGAPGKPAPTVRLGYQRGVAIIEWKIIRVPAEYGVIQAVWDIPDGATNRDDYLLIEPGVPGDGNAIDIRSIGIELVD